MYKYALNTKTNKVQELILLFVPFISHNHASRSAYFLKRNIKIRSFSQLRRSKPLLVHLIFFPVFLLMEFSFFKVPSHYNGRNVQHKFVLCKYYKFLLSSLLVNLKLDGATDFTYYLSSPHSLLIMLLSLLLTSPKSSFCLQCTYIC